MKRMLDVIERLVIWIVGIAAVMFLMVTAIAVPGLQALIVISLLGYAGWKFYKWDKRSKGE